MGISVSVSLIYHNKDAIFGVELHHAEYPKLLVASSPVILALFAKETLIYFDGVGVHFCFRT